MHMFPDAVPDELANHAEPSTLTHLLHCSANVAQRLTDLHFLNGLMQGRFCDVQQFPRVQA